MRKSHKDDAGEGAIGQNVRRLRKARGWHQSDLAERSGVNRTTIIRIEQGAGFRPTTTTLEKLAQALECHITALFADDDRAEGGGRQ